MGINTPIKKKKRYRYFNLGLVKGNSCPQKRLCTNVTSVKTRTTVISGLKMVEKGTNQ